MRFFSHSSSTLIRLELTAILPSPSYLSCSLSISLGEDRAWRIAPATGNGMHATIQNSSILGPSSKFANNALHFTLQKDSEFSATSPNNDYDTFDPIIAFENYVNGCISTLLPLVLSLLTLFSFLAQ